MTGRLPIPDRPLRELGLWLLYNDWDEAELFERMCAEYDEAAGRLTDTREEDA